MINQYCAETAVNCKLISKLGSVLDAHFVNHVVVVVNSFFDSESSLFI